MGLTNNDILKKLRVAHKLRDATKITLNIWNAATRFYAISSMV